MTTAKLYPIFLFSIVLPITLHAQTTKGFSRNQIKFTPTKLLDMYNPGIELGFERFYNTKNSIQLTITYQKEIFNVSQFHNYQGWKYSLEHKFFAKPVKDWRNYLGIELAYLDVDYDDIDEYKDDQTFTKYKDSFHVAKQSISANVKIGTQVYFRSFVVELSAGLGLKYKMVEQSGIQDPSNDEVTFIGFNYEANKEGNYFGINLPMAIKVCYRF